MVSLGRRGVKAKIIDLNTGEFQESILPDPEPATYIFWKSLEFIMSIPLTELKKAFVTMISEPGKARTVTKARACLKIVLDVVSKICSYPLGKGLPSSHSGMKRSNQGWSFFKDMHTQNLRNLVFDIDKKEEIETSIDSTVYREIYNKLFASSTDFETATDLMEHFVASIMGNSWMTQCGIPKILKGIVNATCFCERQIIFKAEGVLKDYGKPILGSDDQRYVILRRGVLMGDPLTKVILHLTNSCIRYSSRNIGNYDFLRAVSSNPERILELSNKAFTST
jgi:hypothetical protein